MGSISTKSAGSKRPSSLSNGGSNSENGHRPTPSISIINYEQSLEAAAAGHLIPDKALEIGDVGGGKMTVNNDELKRVIEEGRKEIKEAQEKLNSSLTTPISESEAKVNK